MYIHIVIPYGGENGHPAGHGGETLVGVMSARLKTCPKYKDSRVGSSHTGFITLC